MTDVKAHELNPDSIYPDAPHEGDCAGTKCPDCGCCWHCINGDCGCDGCNDRECGCP